MYISRGSSEGIERLISVSSLHLPSSGVFASGDSSVAGLVQNITGDNNAVDCVPFDRSPEIVTCDPSGVVV
jgi:hypothetical protein